jgi:hypothetical protein
MSGLDADPAVIIGYKGRPGTRLIAARIWRASPSPVEDKPPETAGT